jgi:hypothetical protein
MKIVKKKREREKRTSLSRKNKKMKKKKVEIKAIGVTESTRCSILGAIIIEGFTCFYPFFLFLECT